MPAAVYRGNLKQRAHVDDLSVDERIILEQRQTAPLHQMKAYGGVQ